MSSKKHNDNCPCGNLLPVRRHKYCSDDCRDKYGDGYPMWNGEWSPEQMAIVAKHEMKWAADKTHEQLVDWYSRR